MKRLSFFSVWIGALVLVAAAMLTFESHLLWKAQELNLFLFTPLFFKQQLVVAGGLLTYLGTFFTQFLYMPWLGVLLLCGWWLLLMWLTKRAFCIADRWAVLALVPVALLLTAIVDQGYWVYMLKLRGYIFVTTLGTTAVVASLWAFRCLTDKRGLRLLWLLLVGVAGYPLLGVYGLAATLLMGIWSWRLSQGAWRVAHSVTALLLVIGIPLLCYRYVYHETNVANIYWAELPLFRIVDYHREYYIPYALLALFYVVLTVVVPLRRGQSAASRPSKCRFKVVKVLPQLALSAALIVGVGLFWFKDENFHRELQMQHCIEQADWEGVVDCAARQQDEPTRAIVMMRNLALTRLGRQGNEMFRYKNGSKAANSPFGIRMLSVVGPLVYCHYGMLNYCTRYCTEMGVEYDWRAEHLKMLTRCALLSGEQQVARKYIGQLKHTLFFSRWAEHAEALLGHPDQIARDPELGFITHMLHYPSILSSDQGFVENFLMNQLSNIAYTGDPIFQEQCLLASLFTHDEQAFWVHFGNYVRLHPNAPIPLHYQEAAYLYGRLEGRPHLDDMPFDRSVVYSYNEFRRVTPQYDGMDVEEARAALYPLFGKTYYYDYFLMSNLPQY